MPRHRDSPLLCLSHRGRDGEGQIYGILNGTCEIGYWSWLRGKWRATNLDRKSCDGVKYRMERYSLRARGRYAEPGSDGSGSEADRSLSRTQTESITDALAGAAVSL